MPHDLLQSIAHRDACTLLGSDGESWPDVYIPDMKNCQLCGSLLGDTTIHPGQSASHSGYLITELNPFKQVKVLVPFCSPRSCSAMHQASVDTLSIECKYELHMHVRQLFTLYIIIDITYSI